MWPDLNIARYYHACVCINNNNSKTNNNKVVYAIGGNNSGPLDRIEELDLSVGKPRWRILPQRLKKKRSGCSVVVDPTNPNNLIVVGG